MIVAGIEPATPCEQLKCKASALTPELNDRSPEIWQDYPTQSEQPFTGNSLSYVISSYSCLPNRYPLFAARLRGEASNILNVICALVLCVQQLADCECQVNCRPIDKMRPLGHAGALLRGTKVLSRAVRYVAVRSSNRLVEPC